MLALKRGDFVFLRPSIVLHSLPAENWFYAFNVASGDQFRLNQTSFWVLEQIGRGIEWTCLRESYLATFEVSSQQGEADLSELIDELCEQDVIRRQSNGEEENEI